MKAIRPVDSIEGTLTFCIRRLKLDTKLDSWPDYKNSRNADKVSFLPRARASDRGRSEILRPGIRSSKWMCLMESLGSHISFKVWACIRPSLDTGKQIILPREEAEALSASDASQ